MHMKKLILATGNPGKVREMKQILKGLYDEILSMKEAGIAADVEEDADTFWAMRPKKRWLSAGLWNAMSFQMIPGFA